MLCFALMFKEGLKRVEQTYYHALGIEEEFKNPDPAIIPFAGLKIEYPPAVANVIAITLLRAKSKFYVWKHKSIIEGQENLPKEGSVILASNHQGEEDTYKISTAIMESGRVGCAVVKKGLVVKGFTESDSYLASIGAEEDSFHYKPLNAFVMKRMGVIPVNREDPDYIEFMEMSNKVLRAGRQEIIFLQPHRYADCILRNLQVGAAILAKSYPNTQVILMASSNSPEEPDKLTILPGVTYNGIKKSLGRKTISAAELTIIFADMIAPDLPKPAYEDWRQETRETEFNRLTSRRRLAVPNT